MEKMGKELAKAYMAAYDEAMNKTFNAEFANQVAAVVTMSIANRPNPQEQARNLASQIFGAIVKSEAPKKKPDKNQNQKKEDGRNE